MTFKEFFSFKKNGFFWFNIVAMIVVVCGMMWGVLHWLDVYTRHGEAVVVPDVKGMSVRQAEAVFQKCGLVCEVSDSTYRKDLTPGCILDYNPPMGQKVKEGRIIYLTINTLSIPPKPVPDVADNSSLREAERRLQAAGFKLAAVDTVPGERDWVYGVKYQGRLLGQNAQVPTGAALVLVVGDGEGEGLPIRADSTLLNSGSLPAVTPADGGEETMEEDSWF